MIEQALNGKDSAKPLFVQVRGMINDHINLGESDMGYCRGVWAFCALARWIMGTLGPCSLRTCGAGVQGCACMINKGFVKRCYHFVTIPIRWIMLLTWGDAVSTTFTRGSAWPDLGHDQQA